MLITQELHIAAAWLREQHVLMLLALLTSLVLCYFAASVVRSVYFHPLSRYPGPALAAASRLWYCRYALQGRLPFILVELHEKYGDVVRIAPDELSYTNPDGWNDIYGHRSGKGEVQKDPLFYSSISSGPGSIINSERSRHGPLRKQMSHGFSDKALRSQEESIRVYADLFIQRLHENCGEGTESVDMVKWFNFFTFDLTGDLVFGESFQCLEKSGYHPWVELIFDSVKTGTFLRCSRYFSPLVTKLASIFLLPADLTRRRKEQRAMAKAKADYRKQLETTRPDLISGLLKPESDATDLEYRSTVETLIIAGSETTATLMSGLIYQLLKNPDKLKKVVDEIRSSFSSAAEINFVSVNKLSYLLACLDEALRVYPPVPDAFPRNTGNKTEIICGQEVPPQTVVRMSHWATYRSPKNFTRPDEYIPERWLMESGFEKDNKLALQAFHVGPRNCLGRNLAVIEMRLLIALLFFQFDIKLKEESRDWANQKVFLLWEKPPLMVNLTPR